MPIARRHHIVPQFYLRNFMPEAGSTLFVADLLSRKTFNADPRNIAVRRDFHTVSAPDQDPDVVEKGLADLESKVAPALLRIVKRQYVGDDDDAGFVLFFATLLLIKTPQLRIFVNTLANSTIKLDGQAKAAHKDMFDKRIRALVENGTLQADVDTEELRQFILGGAYKIEMTTEAHLDREFGAAQSLYPYVADYQWNLHYASAGHFVTCDRPVILTPNNPNLGAPYGLGQPNTRILFPLSSTTLLVGGRELAGVASASDEFDVARLNGRIIFTAPRQIYARDHSFNYTIGPGHGIQSGSTILSDDILYR